MKPLILLFFALAVPLGAADFSSTWTDDNDRIWTGAEYWANPLQDWRVANGRAECAVSGGNRNLYLLTHEATDAKGDLKLSVTLGRLDYLKTEALHLGWGGFRIGIKGTLPGYRNAAIHGKGLDAGIETGGAVFIGNSRSKETIALDAPVDLLLIATPSGKNYLLTLVATASGTKAKATAELEVPAEKLTGSFALVSHFAGTGAPAAKGKGKGRKGKGGGTARAGNVRFWFKDWKISGSKVAAHPDRAFGPILWTQHTLSRGTLKMTAFLPPIGPRDVKKVRLEARTGDAWIQLNEATIDPQSRTATLRVANWDDSRDVPYRVAYEFDRKDHHYTGTIRKDPVDKPLVVAGFTGNQDYLFPNNTLARNVAAQDPDLLFFSGDQIYESVAGYGFVREPVDQAVLDYLRKFWLYGWAFGDLMRDRPVVVIPDDHDVYQGNIWGQNGRAATAPGFPDGGFRQDPEFVNAVMRTHADHLPDPYDPTPMLRGISVYYTSMNYGRVSFAILADRYFKTGPQAVLPNDRGRPDHVYPEEAPEGWDPLTLDVPEARLLGERQLNFLHDWAADWEGADFKCALSQTIFCNLANYHGGGKTYLVADLDSNGWPQGGRNRALHELRRGYAFMYAGDQHLASIVHHGINQQRDAGWSFCVPSIAAGYPRSWLPDMEGRPVANRPDPGLPNTGEYREGLGNRVAVFAVGNPADENNTETPETLGHDKASGHGLVHFNSKFGTITMECYRLLWDANNPGPNDQFPGWPRTINKEENYGRAAIAHLPTLKVKGMKNPVVQVVDETFDEIVYTLRINGATFRPKIFDNNASYTIIVGEPSAEQTRIFKNIRPATDENETLEVSF